MAAPAVDEFEISVFGRGSGEAIAIHAGQGRWILIDSLLSGAKTPVALDYLDDIAVDADRAVEAALFTHWHDDHIAGAAQIVDRCANAVIAIPATLQSDEFLGFVEQVEPSGAEEFGSGVVELQRVISLLKLRKMDPRWSAAERRICGGPCDLFDFEALSPSDRDISDFLGNIRGWLSAQAVGGRLDPPERNDSSVAAVLSADGQLLLFGADLEVNGDNSGWKAVHVGSWKSRGRADFFKIPHHGSKNAHLDAVWQDILVPNVFAALTPWNKNKGLPTSEDVSRILALTPNAFSASRPVSRKALKRMKSVDLLLRNKGVELLREHEDIGHVRFRRKRNAIGSWNVELFGVGCAPLSDLAA